MPAIYAEFTIREGDSLETMRRKLYLGEISAGEQAYTLGAAIGECRKAIVQVESQVARLDDLVKTLREGFQSFKIADDERLRGELNGRR